MEPIVNPWLIYLIDVVGSLDFATGLLAASAFVGYVSVRIFRWSDEEWSDKDTRLWRSCSQIFLPILIVSAIMNIILPARKTMIAMVVAQRVTADNISSVVGDANSVRTAIKQDIIEIIQAVEKDK
ncbi:MAG: hypothetical protein GY832_11760 [Chloroflexi bacterium]|nr:hypothetical protein [Chloroflexota bacterium]